MKVRKNGKWELWKLASKKHDLEIMGMHVVTILIVFIVAVLID